MDNKHSKCFIVRQSKRLKFMPKMRQNIRLVAGFRPDPLGSILSSHIHPSRNDGLLLRVEGRRVMRKGKGRVGEEEDGK